MRLSAMWPRAIGRWKLSCVPPKSLPPPLLAILAKLLSLMSHHGVLLSLLSGPTFGLAGTITITRLVATISSSPGLPRRPNTGMARNFTRPTMAHGQQCAA